MKIRMFKGSPFAPFRFGVAIVRRHGKGGVLLLVVHFAIIWFIIISILGLFEKTSHLGSNFLDILSAVVIHFMFVMWALFTAVSMVPKTIAIFRRNAQKNLREQCLS